MAEALDAQLHLSLRWLHIGHQVPLLMACDDSRPSDKSAKLKIVFFSTKTYV